jgi:uncharacterized membrane protein YbhN (UPF0104 family)
VSKEKIMTYFKRSLTILIVAATFIFFGYYLRDHPELIDTITSLDVFTLLLLTIGYVAVTLANAFVLYYSLRFIKKRTSLIDNIILTGYSSIVNFFGPLQSGPGFRAIYLKKRYDIRLRDFFVTTLVFYGFFALINAAIIAGASLYTFGSFSFYTIVLIGLAAAGFFAYMVTRREARIRIALRALRLTDKNFWLIGLGALGVSAATTATYYVEIHHVSTNVSLLQTVVYTAAANLALFVSLTPGAIGIRESFLVLSQQLHGIDTSTIVSASVIDRAFYVGFLLLLFSILLIVNSRKHLAVFQLKTRK